MPIFGNTLNETVCLQDILRRGLETKPDESALVSLNKSYTWRELDQASQRLAANYLALGLAPGDRIASLMPNRCELMIHYLACIKAGLVAVPLNYRYHAPQIDHALSVSGAKTILIYDERLHHVDESEIIQDLHLGIISFEAEDHPYTRFESLLENEPGVITLPSPAPDWPSAIFFTSGSTGPAKGVTHTYGSFEYMFASAAQAFELTPEDVMIADSSFSHLGGFLFSLSALSVGCPALVPTNTEPDELLQLMRKERPTVLTMIPAALFRVVRDHDARKEDFSSLRLMRAGADKVPLELEREFNKLTDLVIDEGYGSSEMGLATMNPPSGLIKQGSIGRPIPGFEVSLRDDDGNEVHAEVEGNNWVKTGSLMAGYWQRPEDTQKVIVDGWFDSGDVLVADEDGYLRFRGRKKQIIVHDGSNISPQEVEDALLEHESIESAGVIGINDLFHGENVRAYVSIKEGFGQPTATELIFFARERIGYRAPEEIVFLEEIPLNPTGKVDRVTLKQMAEGQS
jgi:acyl-coenzyme A synthetase/AMP-(fatty) acid ligase